MLGDDMIIGTNDDDDSDMSDVDDDEDDEDDILNTGMVPGIIIDE